MKRKITLIPVDARPVTRDLPCQIAKLANWEVMVPPKEELGFLKIPGNTSAIMEWLTKTANEIEGFVLSADMLGYGGLVPSRVCEDSLQVIQERLCIVKELKNKYPQKPLMAFSATMRISNNYVNEEEKEYWDRYGEEIFAYSYHSHCYEKTGSEASLQIKKEMLEKIPADILTDYLATRLRNYEMNLFLLKLVEDGVIDVLVFPQDDTSMFGLNIKEQEDLAAEILKKKLFHKVFIYPGADEVANTLVSRMIYDLEGIRRPTFYPFYSGEKGALVSAMYEDRPIAESVKGQIYAFGSHTVFTPQESDILLAVNVPGRQQGDLALQKHLNGVDTQDRSIGEWILKVNYYMNKGKRVAIADLAYANGSDPMLIPQLIDSINLNHLYGYAAWNTAGNTLGTVLAQAAMLYLQEQKSSLTNVQRQKKEQLLHRFLEDYVYQSIVRQKVRNQVDESELSYSELLNHSAAAFKKECQAFLEERGIAQWLSEDQVLIQDVYLPWRRTFEVGFSTRLLEKSSTIHDHHKRANVT